MITENLSTLKMNKLTQAQYDRELDAGNIDENALYLTPDDDYTNDEIDEALAGKAEVGHTHSVSEITGLDSLEVTTDTELSSTSTNPVQNKVIYAALSDKATTSYVDSAISDKATTSYVDSAIASAIETAITSAIAASY